MLVGVYFGIEVRFAEIDSKGFFSFMGLRKRDFSATGGSESGEADPVDHGENLLLRSSAPTFSRVGLPPELAHRASSPRRGRPPRFLGG